MKSKWFNEVVVQVKPIMNAIWEHDFIKELSKGTLSKDKFHFYIHQDTYYLKTYGKVLASISTQLKDPEHSSDFMRFANETIAVENLLHKEFANEWKGFEIPEKSPTCQLYTGFLSEVFEYDSIEISLAAVLPCFWIYKEVGDYLLSLAKSKDNPYQKWIATYGSEDFSNSVMKAINITEYYAQNTTPNLRMEMTKAFLKTAQMEWMFWDSAYKQEKWPV